MVRPVSRYVVWAGEQFNKHDARHEPADMRPEGHAAYLASKGRQPTHKLNEKPVAEHGPGGQSYIGDNKTKGRIAKTRTFG